MKNRWRRDACLVLCGVLLWLLRDVQHVRTAAARALSLCAGTVIPSLFPFLVISGLLIALGFGEWLSPYLSGLMTPLFRLPGQASGPLLPCKPHCGRRADLHCFLLSYVSRKQPYPRG